MAPTYPVHVAQTLNINAIFLYLPLTPKQSIPQLITAIALGIFAAPYASFKSKAKFFRNSFTLDIVAKASQLNLVKIQFFES